MTDENKSKGNLAVIRIKGGIGVKGNITDTLDMLRLHNRNTCVVIPNNEVYNGMVRKAKDYITWGEIEDKTLKELIAKKGQEYKGPEQDPKKKIKYNRFFIHENKKYKKFFRLNSPKKGYGRKGTKEVFMKGGALGYRGKKINDLIIRMI